MNIDMVDKTGVMREPTEFKEARRIVEKRMISGIPQDIELFMQFTTIIEALRIAEIVSNARKRI